MKIIFICGSVEYGRDGVGDYTRRLAGELISKGHEAGILALNEKYISTEINCKQKSGIYDIPVLRLSASVTYKQRLRSARLWIDEHNPEWLSLQFVPYAFHTKGLPFGLADAFANIGKGRLWHIMFHELWIGMDIDSSWKNYLSGLVQKHLIQSFISKLRPKVIHTQSILYLTLLTQLGYNVHHLPLFGNIGISDNVQIDKQV
ncbi:MAG: glycosyltransferase, partial [Ginsengibacter sp.]